MKYHSYYQRWKTRNCWCFVDPDSQDGVGSVSHSLWTLKTANTSFMTVYNLSPPRLPKIHCQQSLTLCWHSFSGCGRAHVSVCVDHQGGQYIENKQWSTNVNILRLTVVYLNATLYSESWNAKLKFGTDRSSQTRQTPPVDGYRSGFGPPRGCVSGFWICLEPNRRVVAVQSQTTGWLPRPIANTTYKHISDFTWSRQSSALLSSLVQHLNPNASLNSFNHILQVHLQVHSIIFSRCFSDCSGVPYAAWFTLCISIDTQR